MKIKAVIIFPNITRIFHTKSQNPSQKIGWATTVWTLTEDNGMYWKIVDNILGPSRIRIHTLSLEKKRRFAVKLAKEFNCKIIYLDKTRAYNSLKLSNGSFKNIPFRESDLCR